MNYLALGDSISIDDYTGVVGGGAVNQFARLIHAQTLYDYTRDGCTTDGVLRDLQEIKDRPDIVTLTAGGNDLLTLAFLPGQNIAPDRRLLEQAAHTPLENLKRITQRLAEFRCPVILNTIYDPTDGDDSLAGQMNISPQWRSVYDRINSGIRDLARQHQFLLSDLQRLFGGHGIASHNPWLTMIIEPNYAGATAIALHWLQLYRQTPA